MPKRIDRVNVLIRQELAELIQRELKDPRLQNGLLSVTEVSTSRDLSHATVYISHLGNNEELAEIIGVLNEASTYLRNALRGRVKLRQLPVLKFEFDPSIEHGAYLASVIKHLKPPSSDV